MSVKTPIKATFTGSDVTGLAEYQAADFIGVVDGGTGAATHTANAILLGNGTSALQSSAIQISGTSISTSDSTQIQINEGLDVSGALSVGGALTVTGNLTVQGTTTTVNSSTIEITNSFTFEGSTADAYETVLGVVDPTADRTINLPNASGTIVLQDTTDTLTNKTINSASNTITITESNISDLQSYILAGSTDTLTNKSISLTSNTLTGTTAEFNTALSDGSFATLAGTETLTNKTIDADNNTISNIGDSELSSGISATKIADGSISNTEFQYLNGVTSNIQTQLNTKASTAFAIAQAVALG